MSCGDTSFCFSKENIPFLTVSYLVNHIFFNFAVSNSKIKPAVFQLLEHLNL